MKLVRGSMSAFATALVACTGNAIAQLSPDQAVVVDGGSHRLYVLDASGAVLSFTTVSSTVGRTAIDVNVTPDGRTAIVCLSQPQRLDFYDLMTSPPTRTGTLALSLPPGDIDLACTQSGLALIVSGAGNNRVVCLNVNTRTIVNTLTLPIDAQAQAVELSHDGTLALVAGSLTNTVRVIRVDPATGVLTDTGVNVPRGSSLEPTNITISPNGRTALVVNRGSQGVDVLRISGTTVSYQGTIPVGAPQFSAAFTANGQFAYVYLQLAGVVAKLAVDSLDNVTDTGIRLSGVGLAATLFGIEHVATTSTGKLYVRANTEFRVFDTTTDALIAGPTPLVGNGGGGIATRCLHNVAPTCMADFSLARAEFLEPSPEAFVVTEGTTIVVPITVGDADGDNLTVTLAGPAGASIGPVTSGAAPFTTQFSWTPVAGDKSAAPHAITITVTDPHNGSSTCTFQVADVNLNPISNAGGNENGEIVVSCAGPAGTPVQLDGTAADPDGPAEALAYHWDVAGVQLDDPDIANPTGTFPGGKTMAVLTVTDDRGGISTSEVDVVVIDSTPPQVECATDLAVLWPPDHKMRTVEIRIRATDQCTDPTAMVIRSVTVSSDEPDDAAGCGDGQTTGDVHGADAFTNPLDITPLLTFDAMALEYRATIQLRAESDRGRDGRRYTINVVAFDASANPGTASCFVTVPQRRFGPRDPSHCNRPADRWERDRRREREDRERRDRERQESSRKTCVVPAFSGNTRKKARD